MVKVVVNVVEVRRCRRRRCSGSRVVGVVVDVVRVVVGQLSDVIVDEVVDVVNEVLHDVMVLCPRVVGLGKNDVLSM